MVIRANPAAEPVISPKIIEVIDGPRSKFAVPDNLFISKLFKNAY
jgi:hypothetical protein